MLEKQEGVAAPQEEEDQHGASPTVLLKDGVTQFYRKVREIEPEHVSKFRDITITVQNLTYTVKVPAKARIETIQNNKYLPRGINLKPVNVLDGVNLQFKAGTVSLLLGPPGCGKTTLLKALAGALPQQNSLTGQVLFNGLPVQDVDRLRTVALVDQTDNHIPVLTVRETLEFASNCQVGRTCEKATSHEEEYGQIAQKNVDIILRLLGLDGCADTIVGNAAIRGVSGGQRRRVTSAEVLVSGVPVLLGDEISTGLDSSATLDIVSALKSWARATSGTVVLALLQPQPEVVALFDQIICLDQGKVVCAGTRQEVEEHYFELGFQCPPRKDFADFLQEVTSPDGRQYFHPTPARPNPASSVEEFAQLYSASPVYEALEKRISTVTEETSNCALRSADAVRILRSGKDSLGHFANTFWESTGLLFRREWTLAMRDKYTLRSLFGEAIIVGLLMSAIFFGLAGVQYYSVPRSGVGALFFCCAILQRQAWQQIPILMRVRPTFYKQRRRDFFPTASFVLAFTAVQIPFNVAAMAIFCPLVYFMVGYTVAASNFLFFFLTLVLLQHALRALFTCIAAATRSASSAQFSCSVLVVCFLLFSGYILPINLIPPYWVWVYWINPLAFALRSLMINEYTSDKYTSQETLYVASAYGIENQLTSWFMWAGPLVLAFYFVLFTGLTTVLLHHVRFDGVHAKALVTEPESTNSVTVAAETASSADSDIHMEGEEIDVEAQQQLEAFGAASSHPFTPMTLSFHAVSYTVFPPKGDKEGVKLLRNVSGLFSPGTMTALMGSSGAGKTTLMDVVAGRKTTGKIEGTIAINGHVAKPSDFARISGYCEQMDIHSPAATVREAFLFSAALRQPECVPETEKEAFVDSVIRLLELTSIQDRLIGESSSDGLSVEQRKRVTIGVELSANPSIIFADEPTSGLDARAAMVVMRALRKVAEANRTVVATIHQPSAAIFEMFDNLLLLQRGGVTIYNGALGAESTLLIDYFERNGAAKILNGENPANYMLRVIGAGVGRSDNTVTTGRASLRLFPEDQEQGEAKVVPPQDFAEVYASSSMRVQVEQAVEREMRSASENILPAGQRATSFSYQLSKCSKKAFTTYYRSPQYNLKRMLTLVILGVLFGTAFLFSGAVFPITTSAQARSFAALIYLCMDFIGILFFTAVLPITFRERTVYYRERAAQMYSSGVYMAAMFLVELPYLVASLGVFVLITYFLVGLEASWFGYFFLVFWLYVSLCTYIGQLFAIVAPHEVMGQVLIGLTTVVFNLASGYLVSRPDMPVVVQWIFYISPSSYAFNGLASTQLAYCPESGGKYMGCNWLTDKNMTLQDFAEQTFDLQTDQVYTVDIPVLVCFWVATLLACGLSLKFINHDTK